MKDNVHKFGLQSLSCFLGSFHLIPGRIVASCTDGRTHALGLMPIFDASRTGLSCNCGTSNCIFQQVYPGSLKFFNTCHVIHHFVEFSNELTLAGLQWAKVLFDFLKNMLFAPFVHSPRKLALDCYLYGSCLVYNCHNRNKLVEYMHFFRAIIALFVINKMYQLLLCSYIGCNNRKFVSDHGNS